MRMSNNTTRKIKSLLCCPQHLLRPPKIPDPPEDESWPIRRSPSESIVGYDEAILRHFSLFVSKSPLSCMTLFGRTTAAANSIGVVNALRRLALSERSALPAASLCDASRITYRQRTSVTIYCTFALYF